MESNNITRILEQLADHEKRLARLEGSTTASTAVERPGGSKQRTLREIVKGRKFKNGQEQLAVIVGYHEVILGNPTMKTVLKDEWLAAKMLSKYDAKFLERAKDVFFRIHSDNTCILTQTGEEFFDEFLKNESTTSTSK